MDHSHGQSFEVENRGVVVNETGSYLRLIDSCITQLQAQGPSGTCYESEEKEEGLGVTFRLALRGSSLTGAAGAHCEKGTRSNVVTTLI